MSVLLRAPCESTPLKAKHHFIASYSVEARQALVKKGTLTTLMAFYFKCMGDMNVQVKFFFS